MKREVVIDNRGGHHGSYSGGEYGNWGRVWASDPATAALVAVTVIRADYWSAGPMDRLGWFDRHVRVEIDVPESLPPGQWVAVERLYDGNGLLGRESTRDVDVVAGEVQLSTDRDVLPADRVLVCGPDKMPPSS